MSARGNLGAALCRLGRLREARSVLRSVLADRERTKGPDHRDTLSVRNNLAAVLHAEGRYREAAAELRAVAAADVRVHGEGALETLRVLDNLANVLIDAGDRQEAARLLRGCLDGYRRILGPSHPLARAAAERLDWLRDNPS
ncbi:tetratricopeptide TPR_4 [Streptomyces sp. e14]|uniref:tetratricopeptide repeat protein n=2 Tax=unclassified Streptomyces TaxID=2593676 RepID=UPI0001D06E54|nr:tetratricopeptide repeat protein [Streptomyces sp. e14]EFF93100.1 tetratricopeptide TPR_4 [Streptomyces sp. e14]